MKRFYRNASWEIDPGTGARQILLDGRPVKTPARQPLAVPGDALAEVIVAEWMAQTDRIDPAAMPMTGFANATIDRVLPDVRAFAAGIAAYGGSDLLCYRAEEPAELVAEQAALWDPLLAWAREHHGVEFAVTGGIMPVDQPAATLARLGAAVDALDPWLLAGLSILVSVGGSLVGALALIEDKIDAEQLWQAVHVDEDWQERHWGEDAEALARMEARRAQFHDAVRYCALAKAASGALRT